MTAKFRVSVAATWLAKYRRLRLNMAPPKHAVPVFSVLKAGRIAKVDAGEDAFFQIGTPKYQYLGVADGVGSWEKAGVDPSIFSWSLMNYARDKVKEGMVGDPASKEANLSPLELLHHAYESVLKDEAVKAGSSTASLLRINKHTGMLDSANLGDSSFLIIRDRKEIIFRSPEQQHFFNCPYQLAIRPNGPSRDGYICDKPSDAAVKSIQLKDHDIVILATDGYFDNMFDQDTLAGVQNALSGFMPSDFKNANLSNVSRDNIAEPLKFKNFDNIKLESQVSSQWLDVQIRRMCHKLAARARLFSLDKHRRSPWTEYVLNNYHYHEAAGKIDDITILVALIQKDHQLSVASD
ncbi:Protein phosphatase 2C 7 [Entomophthora muscae]|uniref:Protein phosphatase 2C 7 n=1 Tax=Entomophthora muscae TaxID=34485 RepID=A0ACC2RER3_9FUNG|nr:Protein phosphatase 2C 7 [Entomophthora muscae]